MKKILIAFLFSILPVMAVEEAVEMYPDETTKKQAGFCKKIITVHQAKNIHGFLKHKKNFQKVLNNDPLWFYKVKDKDLYIYSYGMVGDPTPDKKYISHYFSDIGVIANLGCECGFLKNNVKHPYRELIQKIEQFKCEINEETSDFLKKTFRIYCKVDNKDITLYYIGNNEQDYIDLKELLSIH